MYRTTSKGFKKYTIHLYGVIALLYRSILRLMYIMHVIVCNIYDSLLKYLLFDLFIWSILQYLPTIKCCLVGFHYIEFRNIYLDFYFYLFLWVLKLWFCLYENYWKCVYFLEIIYLYVREMYGNTIKETF